MRLEMQGRRNNVPNRHEIPTIGLIHGSYHDVDHWGPLIVWLWAVYGINSRPIQLPLEDPDQSLGDYARKIADELGGLNKVVAVAHSSGGNPMARAVSLMEQREPGTVQRMICVGSAPTPPATSGRVPAKNTKAFTEGLIYKDKDKLLSEFDPRKAPEVFYTDCTSESRVRWAVSRLRSQYRRPAPFMRESRWPQDVPMTIICPTGDRAINPEWTQYAAQRLGSVCAIKTIEIPGDHTPQLSRTEEIASIIAREAGVPPLTQAVDTSTLPYTFYEPPFAQSMLAARQQ